MYKNFNLTDQERQQIMEMHTSHGYKKPINEQHQPSNFKQGQVVKAKRDIDNNVYTIKIIKAEQNYLYGTVMGPGNYQNQSLKNGLNVELYSDKPGVISGNQQLGKFTVVQSPVNENPEGDVTEQGFMSRILGNAAKKTASASIDNLARYGVNPAVISLLSKYGSMVMNDGVRAALKNVETEILIVMNDIKRLKASLPVEATKSGSSFSVADSFLQYEVLRDLKIPKGQTIDLGGLYDGILKANSSLSEVGRVGAKISPNQMKLVQQARVNLQDAMKHLDSAIAGFARK